MKSIRQGPRSDAGCGYASGPRKGLGRYFSNIAEVSRPSQGLSPSNQATGCGLQTGATASLQQIFHCSMLSQVEIA